MILHTFYIRFEGIDAPEMNTGIQYLKGKVGGGGTKP